MNRTDTVRITLDGAKALLDTLFWLAAHRAIGLGCPALCRIETYAYRFPVRPPEGWSAPRVQLGASQLHDAILTRLDSLDDFRPMWTDGRLPFDPVAHGVGVSVERGATSQGEARTVLGLRFRREPGETDLIVSEDEHAEPWGLRTLAGLIESPARG